MCCLRRKDCIAVALADLTSFLSRLLDYNYTLIRLLDFNLHGVQQAARLQQLLDSDKASGL